MTITSPHNDKLKQIRKLTRQRRAREQAGRFVAEGEDLLAAADAAGWPALERYCVAGSGLEGVEVEPELLAAASGLGSGTRTLGVFAERWAPAPTGPVCVYLHGIHDPGNVGAVLRSAQAFGASCVALGPGTADPFGPKAVRASMGALFAVPLARASGELGELPGETIALVAGAGVALSEVLHLSVGGRNSDATLRAPREPTPTTPAATTTPATTTPATTAAATPRPLTILVGSERDGLPEALTAGADHIAHIPICTHSLNAAMAATVALYELTHRIPAP
jgi:RNA methyltransferase, TrmH family